MSSVLASSPFSFPYVHFSCSHLPPATDTDSPSPHLQTPNNRNSGIFVEQVVVVQEVSLA